MITSQPHVVANQYNPGCTHQVSYIQALESAVLSVVNQLRIRADSLLVRTLDPVQARIFPLAVLIGCHPQAGKLPEPWLILVPFPPLEVTVIMRIGPRR